MALTATIYTFEINLNDADRGVYQALEFRVARHPSETAEYLLTRVLAYCLEYREGLEFSRGGLSDPDAPAMAVRDLTGALLDWVEIGLPEPARLHKAAKAAPRVAVYVHKDPGAWLTRLAAEPVHRAGAIEIHEVDRDFLTSLVARLARRMRLELTVADRHLYVSVGEDTLSGQLMSHRVGSGST